MTSPAKPGRLSPPDAFSSSACLAFLAFVVAWVLVLALMPAPAFADPEQITVNPASGPAGSTVTVTGTGWTDHAELGWPVPINIGMMEVARGSPDATGSFRTSLQIPAQTPAGEVEIDAIIGNGSSARAWFTVTAAAETVPAPPSNLTVHPVGPRLIRLDWQDNSTNENGFEIHNGDVTQTAGPNTTSFLWPVNPGTYMCVRVRAVNDAGPSAWEPGVSPWYRCTTTPNEHSPAPGGPTSGNGGPAAGPVSPQPGVIPVTPVPGTTPPVSPAPQPVTPVTPAPGSEPVPVPSPFGCAEEGLGDGVPVLLVHGYNEGPGMWTEMKKALGQVPGITAVTFDYSAVNTEWVDKIGPSLAQCVAGLAARSGRSVVVVAHSMGGLAIRAGVASSPAIAGQLGLDVTLGTPNLGSWVSTLAMLAVQGGKQAVDTYLGASPAMSPIWHALVSGCALESTPLPIVCPLVRIGTDPAQLVPPAAREMNLLPGSRLLQLPALPSNVPVLAVAGQAANVVTDLFGLQIVIDPTPAGDLVVERDSAIWGGTHIGSGDGTWEYDCGLVDLGSWAQIRALPCWHNGLPTAPDVEQHVTAALRQFVA